MKPLLTVTKRNGVAIWLLQRVEERKVNPPWQYDEELKGYWITYFSNEGLIVEVLTMFNAFDVVREKI